MKRWWKLAFSKKAKLTEAERSFSARMGLLAKAICDSDLCPHSEGEYCGCSVMDVFDGYFVYRTGWSGEAYKVDYAIADDGSVTLGTTPTEVLPTMTYPDAPEPTIQEKLDAQRAALGESVVSSDCIPLTESALSEAATAHIKLIAPGWGSSGYYSKETLRKAAPVFGAGTKMFWNHQTAAEEASRPEGDLSHLAGELLEDAIYREDHPSGPGLYAKARVFDRFKDAVKDLKDSIGVSIRAYGRAEAGEAEGRKGPVIKEITAAKSVDYVTVPGAGGKALELFESAGRAPVVVSEKKENEGMNEEQVKALMEARVTPLEARISALTTENAALRTDAARLREGLALTTARDFAVKRLNTINLPQPTRARLAESLAMNPPTNENGLDVAAFTKLIDEAAKREAEYLTGLGVGGVRGVGSVQEAAVEVKEADLVASFVGLGMSEAAAKVAAGGRN